MQEIYQVKTRPLALAANMAAGDKYRITMLTEGLVRLEYSEDGIFEDRATQMAFYRDFPKTEYRIVETEDVLEIRTSRIHLIYNRQEFSSYGLSIQVIGNISAYDSIWHYGEEVHDLGGTARTLDLADGAVSLDSGVASWFGFSVIDDSRSQIVLENGWIEPRKKGIKDLYFFGYGHDYKDALRDFYYLCGTTPLLPRFALGNWWSRYYKYTEQSYMQLMERFDREEIPFTVAVIDMDWHLVDIDPKYGSGWTGYTWNKELFPDPARFLKWLHDRGMRTTLNVHPADGVQAYEEMYEKMAEVMHVDAGQEDPVVCDLADEHYLEAYFKYLHHPREKEGVDFWWIDWQQGSNSKVEGLDPLWILNHYHFLDSRRNGKRPITFSRYAGPGSHRYPVGFSGDTITTWESLEFQPYFTSTAANVGYGWWSHDIGGHMQGYKNDEMTARWTQFGIYSPIMRLHSSNSEFCGKEPWRYCRETELVMGEALRERHRMMPYLYTMNYRSYKEGLPIVLPMYYEHPQEKYAYQVKNQYYFGSELIVAPITTPRIKNLNVSRVTVWLPEGVWYDIYTGVRYEGGRLLDMYRDLTSVPVLAKAGGILPFTDEIGGMQAGKNPESLRIKVFAGADGSFTLYEDDNDTCGYEEGICVTTAMSYTEDGHRSGNASDSVYGHTSECVSVDAEGRVSECISVDAEGRVSECISVDAEGRVSRNAEGHTYGYVSMDEEGHAAGYQAGRKALHAVFDLGPAQGELSLIPHKRSYIIEFMGFGSLKAQDVSVTVDGEKAECGVDFDQEKHTVIVSVPQTEVGKQVSVCLERRQQREDHVQEGCMQEDHIQEDCIQEDHDRMKRCFAFLDQAEIEFRLKDELYSLVKKQKSIPVLLAELHAMKLDADLYGVLAEIFA